MAGDKDIPLPASLVTEKRGRGRPRKPDALTNAQRQAAFRARRKASRKTVTVTQNISSLAEGYDALVLECERLRGELVQAHRALAKASRRAAREDTSCAASAVLAQPLPADESGLDDKRLVTSLSGREFFSLERLAAHCGLPKRVVLERLLWWADRSVVQSFGEDDAAFNRYLSHVTKNREK